MGFHPESKAASKLVRVFQSEDEAWCSLLLWNMGECALLTMKSSHNKHKCQTIRPDLLGRKQLQVMTNEGT